MRDRFLAIFDMTEVRSPSCLCRYLRSDSPFSSRIVRTLMVTYAGNIPSLLMEQSMDSGKCESDPIKIQAIRECLEKQFVDVKFSQAIRPTFTFNSGVGKLSWHLVINREFLAARISIEELRRFVEEKVIKKVHENPGKRIQISKYRDITVEEKYP